MATSVTLARFSSDIASVIACVYWYGTLGPSITVRLTVTVARTGLRSALKQSR